MYISALRNFNIVRNFKYFFESYFDSTLICVCDCYVYETCQNAFFYLYSLSVFLRNIMAICQDIMQLHVMFFRVSFFRFYFIF